MTDDENELPTFAKAWNPLSVKCEQQATSRVLKLQYLNIE
jgi:hypothetical protein